MRLTCLKCGHQIELATGDSGGRLSCICGQEYTNPQVVNTGTRPNERAAERLRSRAFRAAGLVKNVGGFALGISLLGVLFFPFGLVGAVLGIYVLTMLRGPVGRYSGRRAAMLALAIGVAVFAGEGAMAMSWLKQRREQHVASLQQSAGDDLRALLRAERLYRASFDTYGTFKEINFSPHYGNYTLYLGPDDVIRANRDGESVMDPLPESLQPGISEHAFTAVAVGNLDSDTELDIWVVTDSGRLMHVTNDFAEAP